MNKRMDMSICEHVTTSTTRSGGWHSLIQATDVSTLDDCYTVEESIRTCAAHKQCALSYGQSIGNSPVIPGASEPGPELVTEPTQSTCIKDDQESHRFLEAMKRGDFILDQEAECVLVGELRVKWTNHPLVRAISSDFFGESFSPIEVTPERTPTGQLEGVSVHLTGSNYTEQDWLLVLDQLAQEQDFEVEIQGVRFHVSDSISSLQNQLVLTCTPMSIMSACLHNKCKPPLPDDWASWQPLVDGRAAKFGMILAGEDGIPMLESLALSDNYGAFFGLLGLHAIRDLLLQAHSGVMSSSECLTYIRESISQAYGTAGQLGIMSTYVPPLLFDAQSGSIVRTRDGQEYDYIVISHSWGQLKGLKWHSVDGPEWPVPCIYAKVAEQASRLARLAGTRYAWFDLACIPQSGDDALKHRLIGEQAEIFASALGGFAVLHSSSGDWLSAADWKGQPTGFDQLVKVAHAMSNSLWLRSTWTLQETWLRPDMALVVDDEEPQYAVLDIAAWLHKAKQLMKRLGQQGELKDTHMALVREVFLQVGFDGFTLGTASNILAAAARRWAARPEDEYNALKGILGLTQTVESSPETERARIKGLVTAELLSRGDISGLLHSKDRYGGFGGAYHKIGTHLIDGVVPVNQHFQLSMHMGGIGALVEVGQLVRVHDWGRTTGNGPEDAEGALLVALGSVVVPAFGGPQLLAGAGAMVAVMVIQVQEWPFSHCGGYFLTPMANLEVRSATTLNTLMCGY